MKKKKFVVKTVLIAWKCVNTILRNKFIYIFVVEKWRNYTIIKM